MNGVHKKILLLVAGISLLVSVNDIMSAIIDSNYLLEPQITVSTKLNDVSQSDIESVKKETRKALTSIPPILGIEYKKDIQIKIVDYGICNAKRDIMTVPISHVRDKSAAIIHEVTHIIAKHEDNSFFSEGLAVYFQERFGEFHGFPNYSVPLDDLVRNHKDQLLQIPKLKSHNKIFRQVETERRRIAYIEAGSFINFLVVKYGEQKLAELHNSRSLNYKQVYGKEIEKLEVEWKNYVFGNPLMKNQDVGKKYGH
jgi:hypothetical protein